MKTYKFVRLMGKGLLGIALAAGAGIPAFGQLGPAALQQNQVVPCEPVTITQFGPYPRQIQRAAGPFVIAVENHSRFVADTFRFRLKPAAGANADPVTAPSLFDLTSSAGRILDYKLINPQAGEYELVFPNHPAWKVAITITGGGQ